MKLEKKLKAVTNMLDTVFNGDTRKNARETAFILLTFPFKGEGRCHFVSNDVPPDEALKIFKDMARILEEDFYSVEKRLK
jgi:hypothetical protein